MNTEARNGRQTAAGFYHAVMRHVLVFLVLTILAVPARFEITRGVDVLDLTAGVICAPEATGFRDAPGTISGRTHVLDHMPDFANETRIVPAVIGVGFGVRVRAVDGFGSRPMTITLTHPPMGAGAVRQQSFTSTISGQSANVAFFQFDYPYELVTGQWMFEGRTGGDLVYRVAFDVVPAREVPALADICGFRDLLS